MNAYLADMIRAKAAGFHVPELECGGHRTSWDCGSHNCTPDNAVLAYLFDFGY